MAFDTVALQASDTNLKAVIDPFIDSDLCSCDDELKKHINTLIIIRTGIDMDLLQGDEIAATSKLELLDTLIAGGTSSNCNC